MANYNIAIIGTGRYEQSYPQLDRFEVFYAATSKKIAKDQRRIGLFKPKYAGEWKQNPKSSLPQSAVFYFTVENTTYEFDAYKRVVNKTITPFVETITVKVKNGVPQLVGVSTIVDSVSITGENEGLVFTFKAPTVSHIEYSSYVPRDEEEYSMRISFIDDDNKETVVNHSAVTCESMDTCATVAKNSNGEYKYRPTADGTATLRVWNETNGATYIDVTAYTPFFRDHWESFFNSYDVSKLSDKSPFRVLMNILMEFLDAIWAHEKDLATFNEPHSLKYKFLQNLGQAVGFTEMLSINKGREKESFYVRLYRELVSQMFGINQLRGSEKIYTTFFNAIGYDIELLEFWFDESGNLVEINPHDDSKSSYAVYSTSGKLVEASTDQDPRELVTSRASTESANVKNKSWYVLPRLTPQTGSAYSAEFEPVVKEYLNFLRPLHVEYMQTVTTMGMSGFDVDTIPDLTDLVAFSRFMECIGGTGYKSYFKASTVKLTGNRLVYSPEAKNPDRRNVRIFTAALYVSGKIYPTYRPGMPTIFDNTQTPAREWRSEHSNTVTRSTDFRSDNTNNWEHPGGIAHMDSESTPRPGSSYTALDGTVLPCGGGLCNDILFTVYDLFTLVKYLSFAETLFGLPRYDRGLSYDNDDNKLYYDQYSQLEEKFTVTRV